MERPETLDFVDTCARAWSLTVHWVEYFWDAPHRTRIVDHATASRNGEPYAALIDRKGFRALDFDPLLLRDFLRETGSSPSPAIGSASSGGTR